VSVCRLISIAKHFDIVHERGQNDQTQEKPQSVAQTLVVHNGF
jgi:hypothetical protein